MSGGHYDYQEWKIREVSENVAGDLSGPPDPERLWIPKDMALSNLVRELGEELFNICHDVDYHICGDTSIEDTTEYTGKKLERLFAILERAEAARLVEMRNRSMVPIHIKHPR